MRTCNIGELIISRICRFAPFAWMEIIELVAHATCALQKEMRNDRMDYAFKIFGDFFYLDGAAH